MVPIILLALSLLIPSFTHGASASAASNKRKAPEVETEAGVKMRDVGEDNDDAFKKQKLDSQATAPTSATAASASARATAMEIDLKEEVIHDLPSFNPNGEARLFQLYKHYHLYSLPHDLCYHRSPDYMGRALYALRTVLNDGANVDTVDSDGMTVLHYATVNRQPHIIALFLSRNANVHAPRCGNTSTVLHSAVGGAPSEPDCSDGSYNFFYEYRGLDKHTLALFANRGFDFNRRNFDDLTPLLASLAYWGRPYHIEFLISQGANVNTLARRRGALSTLFNRKGRYIHHSDLLDITKLLIVAGTDFQSPSPEGRPPLHEAWLLRRNSPRFHDEKSYTGHVISWLIGIGAQVETPNNEIFWTPKLWEEDPNDNALFRTQDNADRQADETAEKLWAALHPALPSSLLSAPLTKQPNGLWSRPLHCGDLIRSYLHTHPIIEEGYRQRKQNEHFLRMHLALCLNRRKPGLCDLVPYIQRFAGPIIPDNYSEADAKRAHAAQVVPMDEG